MLQCLGVSPVPSLRVVGARCWVGIPPLPSPPRRPLVLGARDRLGVDLSLVSPLSGSSAERTRLGFSSPSFSHICPALWFVDPWPSFPVAGPALAGPLSDASDAPLSYLWRRGLPFSVVAPSALSNCSGRCPAPPSPAAVSIALSGAAVLPRRAAPSPPSRPCPWLLRRWVVFCPLSPAPIRLPPVGIGTL